MPCHSHHSAVLRHHSFVHSRSFVPFSNRFGVARFDVRFVVSITWLLQVTLVLKSQSDHLSYHIDSNVHLEEWVNVVRCPSGVSRRVVHVVRVVEYFLCPWFSTFQPDSSLYLSDEKELISIDDDETNALPCWRISASRTTWASGVSRSGVICLLFHCSTRFFV